MFVALDWTKGANLNMSGISQSFVFSAHKRVWCLLMHSVRRNVESKMPEKFSTHCHDYSHTHTHKIYTSNPSHTRIVLHVNTLKGEMKYC